MMDSPTSYGSRIDEPNDVLDTMPNSVKDSIDSSESDSDTFREDLLYRLLDALIRTPDLQKYFWPFDILSRILTRQRLEAHLTPIVGTDPTTIIDTIGPLYSDDSEMDTKGPFFEPPSGKQFLKIFALLVLAERERDIELFIKYDVCDNDLPLELHNEPHKEPHKRRRLRFSRRGDSETLKCFKTRTWAPFRLMQFEEYQWRVTVPFFKMAGFGNPVSHHTFQEKTILPWVRMNIGEVAPIHRSTGGGYGTVVPVKIHPSSHEFDKILKKNSLSTQIFALKSLNSQDANEFHKEVRSLQRFSGITQPHLIRLLATFELKGQYHMIFPWASLNLFEYWQNGPLSKCEALSLGDLRWMSAQILGLTVALDMIHNHQDETTDVFGRHGDIKPENILWFESDQEPRGVFALADFGLATFHRARTRSNSRSSRVGFTMTYRPPEIDIQEGKVSRASDIWSFGCVLLELACWTLGGTKLLTTFESVRMTEEITGFNTDTFFTAAKLEDGKGHKFMVKREVNDFVRKLDHHEKCTKFVHDLLDLIEKQMILVETDGVKRSSSAKLLEQLSAMDQSVQDDNDTDYVLKPTPGARLPLTDTVRTVQARMDDRVYEYPMQGRARYTKRLTQPSRHSQRRSIRVREQTNAGQMNASNDGTDLAEQASSSKAYQLTEEMPLGKNQLVSSDFSSPDHPRSTLQSIDSTVCSAFRTVTNLDDCEARFIIHWQLQQCLQDELDGNPDLSPILTISGDSAHAWAVSCEGYIEATWGEDGKMFLQELEALLGALLGENEPDQAPTKTITAKQPLFAREEHPGSSELCFRGSVKSVSALAQFLAWIAATFRLPEPRTTTCSSMEFQHVPDEDSQTRTFCISLKELEPLDDRSPGTCWKPLFPSTVMAKGFYVPVYPGVLGLRLPFDAMLEMAEIVCDVSLEDAQGKATGVYLDGIFFLLYPTSYQKLDGQGSVIQWHLERRSTDDEGDRDPALAPDSSGGPAWTRIVDYEVLSSATTVLGYCGRTKVQLGTQSRLEYYLHPQYSRAGIEEPRPEASITSFTLGLTKSGVKSEATGGLKYRKGLKLALEDEKDLSYKQVLRIAQNKPVILFDTEEHKERAWMVSQLSMILELFNIWALRNGLADVRYASAKADGGEAAYTVLADTIYARRTAIEKILDSDPPNVQIGGMIKQLYGRIRNTVNMDATSDEGAPGTVSLGHGRITGWDWLDLIDGLGRTISQRRQVRFSRTLFDSQPCWLPLTQSIPVFFGQRIGELIEPDQPDQVCRQWHPLPGGLENIYLAVSLRCISGLSMSGFQNHVWSCNNDRLFEPCHSCINQPKRCSKHPQNLERKRLKLTKMGPRLASSPVVDDGAIIFASRRKKMNF